MAGVIIFDDAEDLARELHARHMAALIVPPNGERGCGAVRLSVEFTDEVAVDERLRGRSLEELRSPVKPLPTAVGDAVMAQASGRPVWTASEWGGGRVHQAAFGPPELREGERLKDHLAFRNFMALTPLIHFLRELTGFEAWRRPALRASFILDDPNLHWTTYGYIRYPQLADHAAEHGYHVGVAMLPLDTGLAHPGALRLFRERNQLSLLVHGNNHVKRELDRPAAEAEPLAVAAQALRRVASFESRTGTPVCRVMVPPHDDYMGATASSSAPPSGACSEEMMVAMRRCGFEGVSYWGPSRTAACPELVGWDPADVWFGGGLPGLHRVTFDAQADELVLRSFLDQPLILFGHHEDLAGNLRVLAEAAAKVNLLGAVEWRSTTDLVRSNFFTREEHDLLRVRPFSSRVRLGHNGSVARRVVVDPPADGTGANGVDVVVMSAGARVGAGSLGEPMLLPQANDLELVMIGPDSVDPATVPAPRWSPWPLVRRCLTEGRDRVQPIAGRVRTAMKR